MSWLEHVGHVVTRGGPLRDVRYAVRTLRRAPSFTAAVVLTLGLGIGANSAVFSAFDAVLLRPLPFPSGDRLMELRQRQDRSAETNIAPARLEDWHRLNSTFEAITGYYTESVSDTSGDLPERVKRAWVAPRFVEVWGIGPRWGRGFTEAEHTAGGPPAVLISDRYRRRRFGDAENVVGRTLRIGAASVPIVGVMPASFLFPDRDVDLWAPIPMSGRLAEMRTATWYLGVGRLKPGVTVDQARANLALVQAQLASRYPATDRTIAAQIAPLKEVAVGSARRSLWLLFGAVSVLLLITCTNVAALLLSRATQRRHELALRVSLGASRAAVAAQLLTETTVLAIAGGALGLAVAAVSGGALRAAGASLPRIDEVTLDGRILVYTGATTIAVALLCGLVPALRTMRGVVGGSPSQSGRTQVSSRNTVQWILVGTQVALSVMLLTGAALLVRSMHALGQVNPGFDPDRVLTFRISGNWGETAIYERLIQRIDGTLDALRTLPGVEHAATSTFLPGVPADYETSFDVVELPRDGDRRMIAQSRAVSPEYFATMRIPLAGGAPCERQRPGAPLQAMINQSFAARYLSAWPSPAGLHVTTGPAAPPMQITGVVADARERGLDRHPGPVVYTCMSAPNPSPQFLVRTHGEPAALALAVRTRIKELDPLRAVFDVAPLHERIGDAYSQHRLRTIVLAAFAITALTMACVGLYGTLSYVVALRRREIGLRLALGSTRSGVVRHVLGAGLRVALLGCAGGLALSIALARIASGMLFGVSAADPLALATVVGLVLGVTAVAALVPAVRVALTEPMDVLQDV